jgi:hypothetical protein
MPDGSDEGQNTTNVVIFTKILVTVAMSLCVKLTFKKKMMSRRCHD